MTKNQVIKIRESLKDLGANGYCIIFTEDHAMISSADAIVWDDANEIIYGNAINNNHYTQAESPMQITVGFYANIQYIRGLFSVNKFETAVDTLFDNLISDDKKKMLKDYANCIVNEPVRNKNATPYFTTDAGAITPTTPNAVDREDGVKYTTHIRPGHFGEVNTPSTIDAGNDIKTYDVVDGGDDNAETQPE